MLHNNVVKGQSEVIEFLSSPGSYPHTPNSIEKKETHGAMIFIADGDVYKIKKAIKFSYMDFSTPELREKVCKREIEINKPFAPDIYHEAIPITRELSGGLTLNGKGEPVEWAVHMRAFKEKNLMSSIVSDNGITTRMMDQLALTISDYHTAAPIKRDIDSVQQITHLIYDLEKTFKEAEDIFADRGTLFSKRARKHLSKVETCLKSRAEQGYVRRCHGDLHLQNIVIIDEKPVLFDAIEFDEDIATIDILYDLSFLLMDLLQSGFKYAANRILNRYIYYSNASSNIEGLKAMPLFLSCRAGIRAMVSSQQSSQTEGKKREQLIETAQAYMQHALDYLETSGPRLIAIGGLSGTGKTTLASSLAPGIGNVPGALHLRSDLERKAMLDVEETEQLSKDLYSPAVGEKVYSILLQKAKAALKAGHPVIVDAVFKEPEKRQLIEKLAQNLNIPFTGIWLSAQEQTLVNRVNNRSGDASDADADVVRQQLASDVGKISWKYVDASGNSTDTVIEASAALESLQ